VRDERHEPSAAEAPGAEGQVVAHDRAEEGVARHRGDEAHEAGAGLTAGAVDEILHRREAEPERQAREQPDPERHR
jgi:hypothetical protein